MNGKWIWFKEKYTSDDYAEFADDFLSDGKDTVILIASDTNYAIYLNGSFVDATQYATYKEYPVYDKVNLPTIKGMNKLRIHVYYNGSDSFSTYSKDVPGLVYDVLEGNKLITCSGESTKSRRLSEFENGRAMMITPQLSYRFFYSALKEEEEKAYDDSVIMDKSENFHLRENKKLLNLEPVKSEILRNTDNDILVDLKKEETGFIKLDFYSEKVQKIIVSFGEHIVDGGIRRIIGPRDFSFEYTARKGENHFFNPLRRLGLRYIELTLENKIDIEYIGLIPTVYPFDEKPYKIDDSLRQKIYDISVYTLECCYHEHYEDCPWREQSFYAFDSRNQMLSGYYAFKNTEQVKSALNLILKNKRADRLLDLCFPCDMALTIPSFSLHFFKAIEEYLKYTGDKELALKAYGKLKDLLQAFRNNMEDDLVLNFKGEPYWNFYEWTIHLDYPNVKKDCILNSLYIIALESMNNLSKELGLNEDYSVDIERTRKAAHAEFYDSKKKIFIFSKEDEFESELVNACAVLSGIASMEEAGYIAEELTRDEGRLEKMTLSMKCFKYDALLKVNPSYKEYILKDIDKTYSKMINNGATTFYETELGEADFDGAGSLCHGWSALPVYYYHLFNIGKEE